MNLVIMEEKAKISLKNQEKKGFGHVTWPEPRPQNN